MAYPYPYPYQMYPQMQQMPQQASRAVEVFQVDGEQAVPIFPVQNGATQMLLDRNDAFIAVKAVGLDGASNITFYDKRPPVPAVPSFDPAQYVRRDEIESLVAAAVQGKKKKETAE